MVKRQQAIIDRIIRKIARTITLFVEVLGFEVVRAKPAGSPRASIRFIKRISAGDNPKPAPYVSGLVKTDSYFTVNVGCRAGLNHMKSALGLLIKESLSLNRTPVAFAPPLLSTHNFDKEVDVSWDKYINLDKIVIRKDNATNYVKALKRSVIADFDDAFAVLEVNGKHRISAIENAEYNLIIKNNASGLSADNVYGHDDFDFEVGFLPSDAVLYHAEQISRQLGTYHSMHVRRGDMLTDKERYPNLEQDTGPKRIHETVSRVLPRGSLLYILTDERTVNYFDVLKKDYRIYQYSDFPELKALVRGNHPDNFFLYEIEQLIFAKAETKIYTFTHPKGERRISLTRDLGWT